MAGIPLTETESRIFETMYIERMIEMYFKNSLVKFELPPSSRFQLFDFY